MAARLLDQFGRPIDTTVLGKEISAPSVTGVRSVIAGHPSKGLTPQRLAGLLLGAESGDPMSYLELAEDMEEKDLHYLSVLGTRKRAVTQLDITVEAADNSDAAKKHADLVRSWLKRKRLRKELFDVLDAIGKGYSVCELVWQYDAKKNTLLPAKVAWRDPRWFMPDRVDGSTLKLIGDAGELEDLPPYKFIVHEHPAKSGLPIRGGLARAAAWVCLFKNFALKDWVQFAEIFGLPLRVGRYDNGETKENIALLMRAVAQIGADAAAVFPKSMDVEFIDGKQGGGNTGSGELYASICNYLDQQVSKGVLGQTATTDSVTGGLGSGEEHGKVREDIRDDDAGLLAATLEEQLVRPIVDLNFGAQDEYPVLSIGLAEQVDITKMMDAVESFVRIGGRIDGAEVRDKLGFEDPGEDAELLSPNGAAAADGGEEDPQDQKGSPPPKKSPLRAIDGGRGAPTPPDEAKEAARSLLSALNRVSAGRRTPAARTDAIDRAVQADLQDWEPLISPIVESVETLLASCSSLEEASDRLAEALEGASAAELTELIARASFTARLAGLSDADILDT